MFITNDVALLTFVPITILIFKRINISCVDIIILETIAANLIDPEEYELNLIEDSEIEITKIINTKMK